VIEERGEASSKCRSWCRRSAGHQRARARVLQAATARSGWLARFRLGGSRREPRRASTRLGAPFDYETDVWATLSLPATLGLRTRREDLICDSGTCTRAPRAGLAVRTQVDDVRLINYAVRTAAGRSTIATAKTRLRCDETGRLINPQSRGLQLAARELTTRAQREWRSIDTTRGERRVLKKILYGAQTSGTAASSSC